MPSEHLIYTLKVNVAGSDLTNAQVTLIRRMTIDSSLHIPDMFTLSLAEMTLDDLNNSPYKVGSALTLSLSKEDSGTPTKIFEGEITALEPTFINNVINLAVRGYDKAHRLHRGTKTKVWLNTTDSDIVQKIAQEAGLRADVDSTTEVFAHIYQHAQSNFDFLVTRAKRIGYVVLTENGKLKFKKQHSPSSSDVELTWGENLMSFSPRLTLSEQVDDVTVKGWDVQTKTLITGTANSSSVNPAIGDGKSGGQVANAGLSSPASHLSARTPVTTQEDATTVAQGLLDNINNGFIEAEGRVDGMPTLHAGMVVQVKGVGAQFSGKYQLTTVHHEYNAGDYETTFTVEGTQPKLLSDLVGSSKDTDNLWGGVFPAIVTKNSNTEHDYGYVTLKYPWLDDSLESAWARVAMPGAGKERGFFFFPEVNDEVLVAFEHGDFNHPYVIGGLYNGSDAPALATGTAIDQGKVVQRVIKTRTGHTVTFVDDHSGDDYIEIKDGKSKTQIKFDAANELITMKSTGKITLEATSDITIKTQANMTLQATQNIDIKSDSGNVTIQGMQFSAKGTTGASVKSDGGPAALEGLTLSVKGLTEGTVDGGAMLTVKGIMVMIN